MKAMKAMKMIAAVLALALAATAAPAAPGAPAEGAEPGSRRFLLVIDLRQNDLAGVEMSKTAALFFLDTEVRDGDEAAFVTYSEIRGLKVREDFTKDLDRLRKSIETMKEIMGASEEEAWSSPIRRHNFLEEFGGFAQDLAGVPGMKNMVFFTSGFPVCEYQGDRTFRELYDAMSRRFKEAQTPVFVVNSLGHRADWQAIEEKHDFVLKKLAEISGGRYFRDIARYRSITQEIGRLAL
jgi:VWFA-related protein